MARKAYVRHRENQRERILEVAEELFTERGIEQVTIGDLAAASRLTRATIYRYFANKEEMAMEIFKTVTRGWVERDARDVWPAGGTGYELVERFVTTHFAHLFENPHEARFIAEFNHLYAKHLSTRTAIRLFAETLGEERLFLLHAIESGRADGSLRADMDPELILASIFNFNSGMMSRLGELGTKVEGEFAMGAEAIFTGVCRLFLDGLRRAPDDHQPPNDRHDPDDGARLHIQRGRHDEQTNDGIEASGRAHRRAARD
jgi:AcrR family transcriptional regulator